MKDKKQIEPAIQTHTLTKRYSGITKLALDTLSISIMPGEVYGFLGPNGAGKSTTIRLLMNFIRPTLGSATILGKDIVKDSVAIKRQVGYLASDFAVYPNMSARDYVAYLGDLQGEFDVKYVTQLVKLLEADMYKPMGELSRGNRQKIAIIQAFMHKPMVFIMDEPTSGLDPLMQEVFYDLVREAKNRGAAIFMSSHVLSEVQKVCDRVGVIRDGQLISERNIAELAADAAQTFDITFVHDVPIKTLRKVAGVKIIRSDGKDATIHIHGALSPLFAFLAKHTVSKLDARSLDLEEVFIKYYERPTKTGGKK